LSQISGWHGCPIRWKLRFRKRKCVKVTVLDIYKRRFTGTDKTDLYRSVAGSAIVCPCYIRLAKCEDALPQNLECYDVNRRRVGFVAVPCFKAVYMQVLKTVEIINIPNRTTSSSVKLTAGVVILSASAEPSDCVSPRHRIE